MNTKTLSNRALSIIEQYSRFRVGAAVCSIPYFNNKTARVRAALRANVGKGSPKDIFDEVQTLMLKQHTPATALSDESLKRLMVENDIGVDCSAFAYYVLNAESEGNGKGPLDEHISFVNCRGIIAKIRCSLRPVENCNVRTFAHDKNSRVITISDMQPGNIISILDDSSQTYGSENGGKDHILIVHQIEYQNFIPVKIHYSHAIAYPEDGSYGSGIRQGEITIVDQSKKITEQIWFEGGRKENDNPIFNRARRSKTETRKLAWL